MANSTEGEETFKPENSGARVNVLKKALNRYRKMRARWPEDLEACRAGAGPVAPGLAGPACFGRDCLTWGLWQRQRQGDDKVVYGPVKVGAAAKQMLSLTPQK